MMRWIAAAMPSRRRNEQGVVAVVVAIVTCFTLIPIAALAVDIGVQRVARRDAQSVADVVALDLARQLDGRTYAQLSPTMQTLANR
ncbi:MAG: pilus assembly protein TadG-related protein, partial [Marmoricola sp.]